MADKKKLVELRGTIEFLKKQGELFTVKKEMNPIHEIAGLMKELDGGPTVFCEKIKGYPNARSIGNIFSRRDAIAALFDIPGGHEGITKRCRQAIMNPIPERIVTKAPVHEVTITKNIDVFGTIPILKHTPEDAGRILGGLQIGRA